MKFSGKIFGKKGDSKFLYIYIKTIKVMTKFIITEEEKNKILGLYEQPTNPPGSKKPPINPPGSKKPAINPEPPLPEFSKPDTPHPMDTPMWKKMTSDVEGDGVELLQYIPNQKLVIDVQFDNTIYTITAKKK